MAFCRYCGNKLNDGDTVCANCGNEVRPPVEQTPQQNTPYLQQTQEPRSIGISKPSGNKKTAIIIIAILVAIAIIASVSNNINQIARKANEINSIFAEDMQRIKAAQDDLSSILTKFICNSEWNDV
ncbi:MAG: plasmid mobilization relaxosome protein MobC [Ruminococcus sp.]|nr:plasmid mobilization relaxosome protein MobC [Ruminococcus sp.]